MAVAGRTGGLLVADEPVSGSILLLSDNKP